MLDMHFIARIPRSRYAKIASIASSIRIQINWSWNCQDWARALLDGLFTHGFIIDEEASSGRKAIHDAVDQPFTTKPNIGAIEDEDRGEEDEGTSFDDFVD